MGEEQTLQCNAEQGQRHDIIGMHKCRRRRGLLCEKKQERHCGKLSNIDLDLKPEEESSSLWRKTIHKFLSMAS